MMPTSTGDVQNITVGEKQKHMHQCVVDLGTDSEAARAYRLLVYLILLNTN
jgi:hypothetical protein